ncbi:hypothetical protein C1I91_25190 [Clostridium manihotivorum]|uniref:Uncharacterized protein n=1 Tax=Clostridium manihotivorum TaxID=2320868 RepID=A0A3R5UII8_9CLOT|nr:hypothetical protein C1I91_25190 [Clostridium manihotivorum]
MIHKNPPIVILLMNHKASAKNPSVVFFQCKTMFILETVKKYMDILRSKLKSYCKFITNN